MKRRLLLLAVLVASAAASAVKVKNPDGRYYIFRYYLTDKQPCTASLQRPWELLSEKALERRSRQHLTPDSTDLPVSALYLKRLQASGARVVATSRWQNTVALRSNDSLLLVRLGQEPFVKALRLVYVSPDSVDAPEDIRWIVHTEFNRWDSVKNDPYGMARPQLELHHADRLHEAGFTGRGITIAILDGGFQSYDRIPALQHVNIVGTRDFVQGGSTLAANPFQAIDHGTRVLSTLAARAPEVTMGSAPDASYWLLRSEDPATEQPVEEDYWVMAAEFADSVGADVLNSSLGYYAYDGALGNYRLQDLDGQTAFISRAASMLAQKGMVLCNSAGNSGMGQWKKIGVPADARDIITVGAIDQQQLIAVFSSIGPSQDGRVKPDVVAMGCPTMLINGRGALATDRGTSFATPLICGMVACLWQALPLLSAYDIMDLVRRNASQHEAPTNIYGYGIPDFWSAYQQGQKSSQGANVSN